MAYIENDERRRILERWQIRKNLKWSSIDCAENKVSILLAAIVFAFFIPKFFGRHPGEQFVIAVFCNGAAYGIGRLAGWAIQGFYE
jgi:hypothetical protein